MRILVTGGNGFLGRYVVTELRRRGHIVVAPTSKEFDLRKKQDAEAMFWGFHDVDWVVHCAARVGGIGANIAAPGDFFRDNVLMGVNLMDAAMHAGVQKMLTVGTACMYPEFVTMPMMENDIYKGSPAPATAPYAYAKRAILEMGWAYRQQYDFNAVFVIPTNLYGPLDNFNSETGHVIPGMIRKFTDAGAHDVTLWGTGYPTRDFLFVTDAADGIVDALEQYDKPEPVNLGSGRPIAIAQLAEMIAGLVGYQGKIIWNDSMPDGAPYRELSTERAEDEFGWIATTKLEEGLRRTVSWYRDGLAVEAMR